MAEIIPNLPPEHWRPLVMLFKRGGAIQPAGALGQTFVHWRGDGYDAVYSRDLVATLRRLGFLTEKGKLTGLGKLGAAYWQAKLDGKL